MESSTTDARGVSPGGATSVAVAPPGDPLGTIGKFATTELERRAGAQIRRFALQSAARRLLPDEAVARCLRAPIPLRTQVDVYHHPQYQSASLGGLQVCGSPWSCPVCAQKIGERRRQELERAIVNHRAAGGKVLLATITIAHTIVDNLATLLDAFLAAVRRWQSGAAWARLRDRHGLIGMVRALEVTWGSEHGWHPHCHLLLFLDDRDRCAEVDDEPRDDHPVWVMGLEGELYRLWHRAASHHGLRMDRAHGLRLQETCGAVMDYVAKWGREPSRRPWGPGAELARAHTKAGRGDRYTMFDLLTEVLETGDLSGAGTRFREYVACFKGKSQLRWTPGLRARLLPDEIERDDAEVARAMETEAILLGAIGLEDWRRVLRADGRALILNAAASGDWDHVVAVLVRIRRNLESELRLDGRALDGVADALILPRQIPDQDGDARIHVEETVIPIALNQRGDIPVSVWPHLVPDG